jgi:hypothetical protein
MEFFVPRISSEARSAATWRVVSDDRLEPPSYLSREAKALWREVVESRPADYFRPGSSYLLEGFVETVATQRCALKELARARRVADPDRLMQAVKAVRELTAMMNSTAIKLRVSVQTEVARKSGTLDEKVPVAEDPGLLGVGVTRMRKSA